MDIEKDNKNLKMENNQLMELKNKFEIFEKLKNVNIFVIQVHDLNHKLKEDPDKADSFLQEKRSALEDIFVNQLIPSLFPLDLTIYQDKWLKLIPLKNFKSIRDFHKAIESNILLLDEISRENDSNNLVISNLKKLRIFYEYLKE